MDGAVAFTLSYQGNESDSNAIDLYDVAQALVGFQRSLALTAHLVLNDEIITQAPSLKGARIYVVPAEPGSWKITAWILAGATGLYNLGAAQSNSPLGHLMFSLYDYVISESLGVHVDYNKSLGQLYEQAKKAKVALPAIRESQADSLLEKTERAIVEMHRPIFKTESASSASIEATVNGQKRPLSTTLDLETYDFIHESRTAETPQLIEGRVSSYNSNTFKGRIYVAKYGRPVAFEISPPARSQRAVRLVTTSLRHNALKQHREAGAVVHCVAFEKTSRSGHLKSLLITKVSDVPLSAA
jgi:hypothetical protein